MAQVIGLWSTVVKPGEGVIVAAPAAIRVLNVSLGEEVADENGRSVVKLTYEALKLIEDEDEDDEDEEGTATTTTVLCSLTAGKIESTTVDLVLEGESVYRFDVSGKNTIYLSGNYIDQGDDQDPSDDEMGFDSDSEAAGYDLRDVSSDVEMHPDDLESDASRFEEVAEQPAKTQKRPRDGEDAKAAPEPKGKKSKKQKGESGEAVTVEDSKPAVSEKKKDKKKEAPGAEEPAKDVKTESRTTPGGVIVKDVTVGHGPTAKKGSTVSMRYKGRLQNGKIFDQNVKGKPFTFHLGKGEVIKGWDEGIVGMQVEGQRMLTIPANMAYGKRGVDGIPPNSTLIFEVKLLEIK